MNKSNKGRFKCADEAQAVWNFIIDYYSPHFNKVIEKIVSFEHVYADSILIDAAQSLRKACLINGSIYDEHGRIEDKDVAQEVWADFVRQSGVIDIRESMFKNTFRSLHEFCESYAELRGTIFY